MLLVTQADIFTPFVMTPLRSRRRHFLGVVNLRRSNMGFGTRKSGQFREGGQVREVVKLERLQFVIKYRKRIQDRSKWSTWRGRSS